jgi:hypothetical protein
VQTVDFREGKSFVMLGVAPLPGRNRWRRDGRLTAWPTTLL